MNLLPLTPSGSMVFVFPLNISFSTVNRAFLTGNILVFALLLV